MKKFTYRNRTEIIGNIVEENDQYYFIETNEDTYSWEKELTVIEEINNQKETNQKEEYYQGHEIIWIAGKPHIRVDMNWKPRKNGKLNMPIKL